MEQTKIAWIVVGVIAVIAIIVGGGMFCNQLVPKQVTETYNEQEPYVVYESRTSTKTVAEDNCDRSPNCVCTAKYLGIFKSGCKECSCDITKNVPITKYRTVQKQRVVTRELKRCPFMG